MGGKSSPKAPDPMDTAKAQQGLDKQAIRESAKVNQINQVTPYGSVSYSGAIGSPNRTQTMTLSPEQQAVLDSQTAIAGGLGQLGQQQLSAVGDTISQPFNLDSLPSVGTGMEARDQAQQALMGRMEPLLQRDQLALENRLANQGITRGSEAFSSAMDDISRAQNDARLGTIAQAGGEQSRQYGMEADARNRAASELMLQRQQPINELAALLQGSPAIQTMNAPQPAQYQMQAPDITGTTMANYQAQVGQQNSQLGGLYGLGSAGIMAAALSDRRSKAGIKRVGTTDGGQPVYTYYYRDDPLKRRQMGVMAQESPPEAVVRMQTPDGPRLGVDYGAIR